MNRESSHKRFFTSKICTLAYEASVFLCQITIVVVLKRLMELDKILYVSMPGRSGVDIDGFDLVGRVGSIAFICVVIGCPARSLSVVVEESSVVSFVEFVNTE